MDSARRSCRKGEAPDHEGPFICMAIAFLTAANALMPDLIAPIAKLNQLEYVIGLFALVFYILLMYQGEFSWRNTQWLAPVLGMQLIMLMSAGYVVRYTHGLGPSDANLADLWFVKCQAAVVFLPLFDAFVVVHLNSRETFQSDMAAWRKWRRELSTMALFVNIQLGESIRFLSDSRTLVVVLAAAAFVGSAAWAYRPRPPRVKLD